MKTPSFDISGKVAVITGAAGILCSEMAREMAALGYQWDTQAVPPCGEPSDSQEGTEEVPGTSSASSDGAE